MNFEELSGGWQNQTLPNTLEKNTLKLLDKHNNELKKENTYLSYWLAGTIYFTGLFVLPMLQDVSLKLILIAIWFLIGIQVILFWLRQTQAGNQVNQHPLKFVKTQISRLRYNLLVTNMFMPLYMLLLGLLSSIYLYEVLGSFSQYIVVGSIIFNNLFYVLVFVFVWRKQRKKDAEIVIPQIKKLETLKLSYQSFEA